MKSHTEHFAVPTIAYAGPRSDAPLAFKHYDPAEVIDGKTLKEHLRFSIAYWHAFRGTGSETKLHDVRARGVRGGSPGSGRRLEAAGVQRALVVGRDDEHPRFGNWFRRRAGG